MSGLKIPRFRHPKVKDISDRICTDSILCTYCIYYREDKCILSKLEYLPEPRIKQYEDLSYDPTNNTEGD